MPSRRSQSARLMSASASRMTAARHWSRCREKACDGKGTPSATTTSRRRAARASSATQATSLRSIRPTGAITTPESYSSARSVGGSRYDDPMSDACKAMFGVIMLASCSHPRVSSRGGGPSLQTCSKFGTSASAHCVQRCAVIFLLPVGSETGHQWARKARGEISMNSIRGWNATAWCIAWFLGACGGGGKPADTAGAASGASRAARTAAQIANPGLDGPAMTVKLSVLSSPPQLVSGGDARIHVTAAPGLRDKLELWLDGRHLDATLQEVSDGLEGVIRGLKVGDNLLEVKHRNANVRDAITLTNYPITGPMFTGPHQTPFVCTTIQSAVGRQPLVDSATPPGYRVTDAQGHTIGYSRDCSIDTFFSYFYRSTSGALKVMPADGSRPPDLGTVTLPDGRTVDFVVRREIGSINRFLYSIAMLAPLAEDPANPDLSLWNRKLLYWFQGGVAIGHSQGTVHSGSMNLDILARGFAIVHSSGNNTGTHYNMNLAGETAMMTKERFMERYGVPIYTVGLGGSGGAIQQYMIAQNNPGVLDGLLPVQSYPDMVTQTIHVGDCELLEHYMDATDRNNPKRRVTKNRSLLVGMNAEEGFARVNGPLAALKTALGYSTAVGSTECVASWRGLTPLALNPLFGQAPNQQFWEPFSDILAIRWTHYDDLRNVYGVDSTGAARPTWDNVGVQYGL